MPQGDKNKYTAKQKRKAKHIADNYCKLGDSVEKATERAWRTVNPQDGGGLKRSDSGSVIQLQA